MQQPMQRSTRAVAVFAVLHLLCCGVPLLILLGVSLSFVFPWWPLIGAVLAIIGAAGFVWYLKRGCAACPPNAGRCDGEPKTSGGDAHGRAF